MATLRPCSRLMTSTRSNPRIGVRVAAFLFLVVVAANATSFPYIGRGSWWTSGRFWFGRAAIVVAAVAGAWRIQERSHRRRESTLELAVLERTETLGSERLKERERNQILEMLVSNQPLGTVLDAVARLIRSQCPAALCAILMKRGEGCQVAAAPDLPREWLLALRASHAVPFEVWREHLETPQPCKSPAWRIFIDTLDGPPPAVIHSWPIGTADMPLGALLLFYREASEPGESDARIADEGRRMARLALEHRRLYDDLQFQAQHDSLTGLPNRMLYEERLDRSLREAEVLRQKLAVLFIDLDHFKQINDNFSHRIGDLLLGEISRRMTAILRPGDTAARIGGN